MTRRCGVGSHRRESWRAVLGLILALATLEAEQALGSLGREAEKPADHRVRPWDVVYLRYPVPLARLPRTANMDRKLWWLRPRPLGLIHHAAWSQTPTERKGKLEYQLSLHPTTVVSGADLGGRTVARAHGRQGKPLPLAWGEQLFLVEVLMPHGATLTLLDERLSSNRDFRVLRPRPAKADPTNALALIRFALGENPHGKPVGVTQDVNWAEHMAWIDAFAGQTSAPSALTALPAGVAKNGAPIEAHRWTTWCASLTDAIQRTYGVALPPPIHVRDLHVDGLLSSDLTLQHAIRGFNQRMSGNGAGTNGEGAHRWQIDQQHTARVRDALHAFVATRVNNVGARHEDDPTVFSEHAFYRSANNTHPPYEEVPKDLLLAWRKL